MLVVKETIMKKSTTLQPCNGWRSWAVWNTALWIDSNENDLRRFEEAAKRVVEGSSKKDELIKLYREYAGRYTPDRAKITRLAIREILNAGIKAGVQKG